MKPARCERKDAKESKRKKECQKQNAKESMRKKNGKARMQKRGCDREDAKERRALDRAEVRPPRGTLQLSVARVRAACS
eukprot:688580-Pleurochrysis_carterae.AAC.1